MSARSKLTDWFDERKRHNRTPTRLEVGIEAYDGQGGLREQW